MFSRCTAILILAISCLPASNALADVFCEDAGKLLIFRGVDACPAGLSQIDMNDFVRAQAGRPGAKGATGPKGPVGPIGVTGKAGPKGVVGAKGDKGIKGVTGSVGDVGPQGARGVAGDKGTKGAKGAVGAQGDKGPKGDGGGTTGPKGNPGASGTEIGLKGARGPAGDAGQQGHELLWREAILPQLCEEKNESGVVDTGTAVDNSTKNASLQFRCNANQYLYQYSFNANGKLGETLAQLSVAPSVTFVNGYTYIDRIQANLTLKLVGAVWEKANYNSRLICCSTNPVP